MATGECLMPDVCKACSSHGIFYRQLLIRRGDPVLIAAAQEDWNAEEIAGRFKAPAGLGNSVFIDPSQKNPGHPITAHSEERREVACPFRTAGLADERDRPVPRTGETPVQGIQRCKRVTRAPARAINTRRRPEPISSQCDPASLKVVLPNHPQVEGVLVSMLAGGEDNHDWPHLPGIETGWHREDRHGVRWNRIAALCNVRLFQITQGHVGLDRPAWSKRHACKGQTARNTAQAKSEQSNYVDDSCSAQRKAAYTPIKDTKVTHRSRAGLAALPGYFFPQFSRKDRVSATQECADHDQFHCHQAVP